MKRQLLIYLTLVVVGVAGFVAASKYLFSVTAEINIIEPVLSVSPESFSVDINKGTEFVKQIKIKNTGGEVEIYFEKVIEGPDPDSITVTFHDVYGNSIYSSNKLNIPAGTPDNPSEVTVNVHIEVDDDAILGEYRIYIQAKSTA
jgi:uncharacterized membrane protein